MLKLNIKAFRREKIGRVVYEKLEHIIDKLPMVGVRRISIQVYGLTYKNPFRYFASKAIGSSFMFVILTLIVMFLSRKKLIVILLTSCIAFILGLVLEYKDMQKKFIDKKREMGIQFSRFASHCSLFISSGVSVRNAFIESVDMLEEGGLYEILKNQSIKLESGESLVDVFLSLSKYMMDNSFNSFLSTLTQMEKYGDYKIDDIQREIDELWEKRKNQAISVGKETETKLVFSGMIIFMGVMGMITVAMLLKLLAI